MPEDIINQIKLIFKNNYKVVLSKLEEFKYNKNYRIIRCIIFLSEGDLSKFEYYLEESLKDYRDIIFWAEYTNHNERHPERIRNFNKCFKDSFLT